MTVNIANKDSLNMICDFADFKIYLIKSVVYVHMTAVGWLGFWDPNSELRSSRRSSKCS